MPGSRFKGANGTLLGGDSLTGEEPEYGTPLENVLLVEVPQGNVRGVFAKNPATTPKYHTGNTDITKEYMARLFVPFASDTARGLFVKAVPQRARSLAEVLAVSNYRASWGSTAYGAPYGLGYIDFLLQNANEQFQEKMQVVETIGDNYVSYFLGQRPPVFQYSGALLNSYQDDWRSAFTVMYSDLIRGTKLARRKVVVVLAYDDVLVTGALASMQQSLNAEMELAAQFSFSMLVKRYDLSSRSPRAQFQPTPTATYPYSMTPSQFANLRLAKVTRTTWAASGVIYTTDNQRKKSSEAGAQAGSELLTIREVPSTPDPERDYISDTIYNPSVGQSIVREESREREQSTSSQLDEDYFGAPGAP